jgi:hypothetical protein
MENHQLTAANQVPAFAKIVMKVFAMIETNARQNRQMPGDPGEYHPLSIALSSQGPAGTLSTAW